MTVPLACSLSDVDARAQILEWQQLVATLVHHVERVTPTRTELALRTEVTDLSALVDLAQRETRCCPFFRFALELGATSIVFSIAVPDGASSMLDSFCEEITAKLHDSAG